MTPHTHTPNASAPVPVPVAGERELVPVGVTQRTLPPTATGERRYALDSRWFPFLAACRLAPVPLPNQPHQALAAARALGLQGLLLTGGDSLAPYGGTTPDRDATEEHLLAWALAGRIPVLGVCRGMQVLMHFFGARLTPVDGHVATRHTLTPNTPGGGGPAAARTVNSYHALAARHAPAPLEATARCGDVIEAVRHTSAPLEGIMWHPEREPVPDPRDIQQVTRLMAGKAAQR